MKTFHRTVWICGLLTFWLFVVPAACQPTEAANDTVPAVAQQELPGLDELAPHAAELASRAAAAEQTITGFDLAGQLEQQVVELGEELTLLEQHIADWEGLAEWQASRLMNARAAYLQLQRRQNDLQETLSAPLKELEALRQTWQEEQQFWSRWQQELHDSGLQSEQAARLKAPEETFQRSLDTIQTVIAKATQAANRLLALQQDFSAQQESVANRLGLLNAALDVLRQEAFRRNAYSLFDPAYYRQFSRETVNTLLANSRSVTQIPATFFKEQGWVALLQLLSTLLLAGFLSACRRREASMDTDLNFLLRHPWAGGLFLGTLAFAAFYKSVPPLWSWLQTVLVVVAATPLIVTLFPRPLVRRLVRSLAAILLVVETVTMIGLPRPVLQGFLVLLCFGVFCGCLVLVRRVVSRRMEMSGGLLAAICAGGVFSLAGLIGGLVGFATFASNLVDTVLGTIILLLATQMAIRISNGAIATLMQREGIRSRHFVTLLGPDTVRRLQKLARVFLLSNAVVYLFVVWKVFNGHQEAWQQLLSWEFSVGEFSVTVKVLALLLLVLYLASLISWVAQALADTFYMTPRLMEYGVKTALKRLLHYALFTLGFLIAVSMAGFDLEKLTIIAGALGVGIGFGLQNIVNNFVSGLILLFERPVKVGDTINIDAQWGTITKIGLRSTVFETLDRAEIIVPNSELISQKVINWTLSTSVSRLVLPVGVAYGSPLEKVLEILDGVARKHLDVLDDPEASAIFTGFGNSSIDFELRVWIADINKRLKVKSELGQAIDNAFREHGITIPFPQVDLHVRSVEDTLHPLFNKGG